MTPARVRKTAAGLLCFDFVDQTLKGLLHVQLRLMHLKIMHLLLEVLRLCVPHLQHTIALSVMVSKSLSTGSMPEGEQMLEMERLYIPLLQQVQHMLQD